MSQRIEERIDQYLMNKMDQETLSAFEVELNENSELKSKLETQRVLMNGIESFGLSQLKSNLKQIHEEEFSKDSGNLKLYGLIFLIVVTLAMLGSTLIFGKTKTMTPDHIYTAYFHPYNYNSNTRAGSESSIFSLVELYQSKSYDAFIKSAKEYLADNNYAGSDILLAMGIAKLELKQPEEAIGFFTQITAKGDFNFEDEVRWYSALAYIKMENYSDAISTLNPLAINQNADHHVESKEVIKYLNKLQTK